MGRCLQLRPRQKLLDPDQLQAVPAQAGGQGQSKLSAVHRDETILGLHHTKVRLLGWGLSTDISFSSFVLQHSLIVCLEPPSSPQDHVDMLVAAAPDKAETALQVASHHAFIKQANQLLLLSDEDYMVMPQCRGKCRGF